MSKKIIPIIVFMVIALGLNAQLATVNLTFTAVDIDKHTRLDSVMVMNRTQGICPPGWHVPTDEEWKVLAGSADAMVRIGDPAWVNTSQYHGYDAGTNLKAESSEEFGLDVRCIKDY